MSDYPNAQAPAQGESQGAPATPTAPAKPNPLNDRTFRLTNRDQQSGTVSSLRISVERNCVRIAADISRDNSGQWASIILPKAKWGMLKEDITRASKEANLPWSTKYRRTGDAEIKVGINPNGMVYIALNNTQGLEKAFEFVDDNYIEIVDANDQPVTPSELSRRYARNWVREITPVVDRLYVDNYEDSAPARRPGGQGNGGNFQRGQNNFQRGGGNNYPKKQWGNGGGGGNFQRGGGGGNYPKKQWGNNQGGNNYQRNNNGYQQNQGYQQQAQAPAPAPVDTNLNFDDYQLGN